MTTKKCPFCAEDVLAEAKICKHCGKKLGGCPLSESQKRWIYVNHMIGSLFASAFVCGLVGVLVAEYTAIAGGLATIAPPWSAPRNEAAIMYGIGATIFGLIIVGPLIGRSSVRNEIARKEGQEGI